MEKQTTLEPLYELLRRDTSLSVNEAGSSLQRAILKKFFRASRVNIKKAESGYKVKIWPMLSTKKTASFIFNIPQSQMHSFLQSCIKNDTRGRGFYTGMMQYLMLNKNQN